MRLFAILFALALCGCDEPAMCELDNFCDIEYIDGSKQTLVCSLVKVDRPCFQPLRNGQIIISYHDFSTQRIALSTVKSYRFRYGSVDHYGRYEFINGKWQKKGGLK